MTWSIRVAHRDRSEPLSAVGDLARALDGEDRAVARELALQAAEDGGRTVGDLLDRLEASSPAERRELLDAARVRAGLPTPGDVERQERFKATAQALADLPERDEGGRTFQSCHAKDCRTFPTDPTTGGHRLTHERRWFCEQHRHLAQPGDLEPWTSGVRFAPGGGLEFPGDVAAERQRQDSELRRARKRREQRRAQTIDQADSSIRDERGWAEHFATPPGFPTPIGEKDA